MQNNWYTNTTMTWGCSMIRTAMMTFIATSATFAQTLESGEALYQNKCATCHGEDLQGGMAQSLIDGRWQFGAARSAIFRSIKFGIPHMGMPSYQASISDQDINRILDFMMDSEKNADVSPPELPDVIETQDYFLNTEVLAEGLDVPWGMGFLPNGDILITERPGRLRMIQQGKLVDNPISGIPEVVAEGQGGLLDVAVDPNYSYNGWIYLAYSHAIPKKPNEDRPLAMTRIVRGRIQDHTWQEQETLFEAPHDTYLGTRHHYGCRIVFDPQGMLYFSIGDRGIQDHAQRLDLPNGKMHRIYPDGSIPSDNPFIHNSDALPSIYSFGHRNIQGMSIAPQTGRLWAAEHGPLGGDELNLVAPARNYGWPVISYGRNYDGSIITNDTRRPGMEVPNYYWKPSTGICGIDFVHGSLFPKWNNHLLVSSLKYEDIQLLEIENDRVIHKQVIFKNYGRVREVKCGPDGAIYIILNQPDKVIRLTPQI